MPNTRNIVVLTGNLVYDTEDKGDRKPVVKTKIAVQRAYKPEGAKDYPTDFIQIVAFGGTAEFMLKHCYKGQRVTVIGELQIDEVEDKRGERQWFTSVKVDGVEPHQWENSEKDRGGGRSRSRGRDDDDEDRGRSRGRDRDRGRSRGRDDEEEDDDRSNRSRRGRDDNADPKDIKDPFADQ